MVSTMKSYLSLASLITYGVTSSGMTRSLYGINENSGLISLFIDNLISQIQNVAVYQIHNYVDNRWEFIHVLC